MKWQLLALVGACLVIGPALADDAAPKPAPAAPAAANDEAPKPAPKPAADDKPAPADPKPADKPADNADPKPVDPNAPVDEGPFKSLKEKISYGIGLNIGRDLKENEVDVDPALIAKGIADALTGAKAQLTNEQLRQAFLEFQKVRIEQEAAKEKMKAEERKAQGEKNKKDGEAFLAENKKNQGVKTTASGLQYEVVKEGAGPSPKKTDRVSVHYTGKLIDGTTFDSSVDRGEPAAFGVNRVIPGWTEALQLMKVGGKWKIYIPSELAYGEVGAGDKIGPHAVLIFDVELLGIE